MIYGLIVETQAIMRDHPETSQVFFSTCRLECP